MVKKFESEHIELQKQLEEIEKEENKNPFLKELNEKNDGKPIVALCKTTFHARVCSVSKNKDGNLEFTHIDQGGCSWDPIGVSRMKDKGIKFKEYQVSQDQCVDSAHAILEDIAKNGLEASEKKYGKDKLANVLNTGKDTRQKGIDLNPTDILILPLLFKIIQWAINQGKPIDQSRIDMASKIAEQQGECHILPKDISLDEFEKAAELANKKKKIIEKISNLEKENNTQKILKDIKSLNSNNSNNTTIISNSKPKEKQNTIL